MNARTEEPEVASTFQQKEFKGAHGHRTCVDCHTTRTPLWRGGPAGPRSLCNACGIRYRKKKRALLLGPDRERTVNNKRDNSSSSNSSSNKIVGRQTVLHSVMLGEEWKRMHREEEQAAILLMALSGSIYLCLERGMETEN